MVVSGSPQAPALGAAISAAVTAGVHGSFADAQRHMVPPEARRFTPDARAVATYNELYAIYRRLHDAFGNVTAAANLGSAMKDLLAIRVKVTA
jgi:L-ribulokinase